MKPAEWIAHWDTIGRKSAIVRRLLVVLAHARGLERFRLRLGSRREARTYAQVLARMIEDAEGSARIRQVAEVLEVSRFRFPR